jgi:glycosyltransferase involved in cell wall biosynthesis
MNTSRASPLSPRTGEPGDRFHEPRNPPRTLAGATILQIVPALQEEPDARTALNVAYMLLQAGARSLIAGRDGPLVGELKAYGGEWVPLAADSANPFTRRRNARVIEGLLSAERIDIVHAHCAASAWSARRAAAKIAVWLVTTLPDAPPASKGAFARTVGDLARGDRIIAPSNYAATPVMERLGIAREQITVIPRSVDTRLFDPQDVHPNRLDDLRHAWRIAPRHRIVLVPGRVAPWNGQLLLPDVARALAENGHRDIVFAVVGESLQHRRYARSVLEQTQAMGVDAMFRFTGHYPDMPAAFAAADIVAVPAIEPPLFGRVVAQAQAMGKPVVTSDAGVLPEYVVVPPHMPEDVRTGWVAARGDPLDFARALELALALDDSAYRAMSARAREFAEYMFSPDSVAVATRAVYTSLLAREL